MNSLKMYRLLFLIILSFSLVDSKGQNSQTIYSLENKYQSCLDEGKNMLECTKLFYSEIDSLLNKVYKEYYLANKVNQNSIKKQQRIWIKKRDLYISKLSYDNTLSKEDNQMVLMDETTQYVKRRVLYFINLLKKNKIYQ